MQDDDARLEVEQEKAQADQANQIAAAPSRRRWLQKQKQAIRRQVKAKEGTERAKNLAPSARELYARRHAVLDATLDTNGEVLAVTYLRACTCEKAAPHTPSGRTLTMVPA